MTVNSTGSPMRALVGGLTAALAVGLLGYAVGSFEWRSSSLEALCDWTAFALAVVSVVIGGVALVRFARAPR